VAPPGWLTWAGSTFAGAVSAGVAAVGAILPTGGSKKESNLSTSSASNASTSSTTTAVSAPPSNEAAIVVAVVKSLHEQLCKELQERSNTLTKKIHIVVTHADLVRVVDEKLRWLDIDFKDDDSRFIANREVSEHICKWFQMLNSPVSVVGKDCVYKDGNYDICLRDDDDHTGPRKYHPCSPVSRLEYVKLIGELVLAGKFESKE
jgi:hypothetical protein